MKKTTKQKIIVFFIISIFGLSSIAFVVLSITGQVDDNTIQNYLTSPVIEEEIRPDVENIYIQNGISFLRYYYTEKDDLYYFVGDLPRSYTTYDGNIQLIVERIASQEKSISIQSLYGGTEDIENLNQNSIISSLCNHLISSPPECALRQLNITS